MDWQKCMIEDLRKYRDLRESNELLPERIRLLEEQASALQSSLHDEERVQGMGGKREERLLSNIVERDRLALNYTLNRKKMDILERGLERLDPRERRTLELFYIERPHDHIGRLREELGYEDRQIYRLKDEALKRLTVYMYGVTEL